MKLTEFSPFNKRKEILVCVTDGFSLSGIVYSRVGNDIHRLYETSVANMDMAEALDDLTSQLKTQGWQGGHVVLMSPAVINTLIELPVNPKKSRPLKQMTELVRWEVDPLLMQHTTRWSVGQLLVGQGYMTDEQAQAVMDLQRGNANSAGGMELSEKFSFRRFGELAEELGYIRNSQLKAVLSGQEWLKPEADDEQIACGWIGQGEVPDVPGMYYWQVSAVSQSLFNKWHALFLKHGLHLDAMYPLLGASLCHHFAEANNSIVIEIHDAMMVLVQYRNGTIQSINSYFYQTQTALKTIIDAVHAIPIASTPIWLVNCSAIDDVKTVLQPHFEHELNEFVLEQRTNKLSILTAGAALHTLDVRGKTSYVEVRQGGPLPPPFQRVETRAGILIGLILFLILGSEIYLSIRDSHVTAHKSMIDENWHRISTAKTALDKQLEQIKKRKALLDEQKKVQIRSQALLNFYTTDVPARISLVKHLLGALQQSVPDDVIIESIDESGKRLPFYPDPKQTAVITDVEVENFNIRAWALSEASAQSFIQTMKEHAVDLALEVRDPVVKEGNGPLGLDGFVVAMRLVKVIAVDNKK